MNFLSLSFAVFLAAGFQAVDTGELDRSFQSLKEAEPSKDVAKIKALVAETSALARKIAAEPAPAEAAEKEAWASRVEHARTVDVYTEYALYALALQSPPETTIDLLSTLEKQNPKSKYLDQGYGQYLYALNKTGAASKIPAIAEAGLAHLPDNEDLLLVMAETALTRKQSDRALGYANRLVAAVAKHSKPEGMPAADWERKRANSLGRGHWIAGMVHAEKNQHYDTDKDLRAALPYIKDIPAMAGPAFFHLGVANYQLGAMMKNRARILEAAKFSDQSAAIPGPTQQQAWRNAQIMRTEAAKYR